MTDRINIYGRVLDDSGDVYPDGFVTSYEADRDGLAETAAKLELAVKLIESLGYTLVLNVAMMPSPVVRPDRYLAMDGEIIWEKGENEAFEAARRRECGPDVNHDHDDGEEV